ncbi:hypothetical protein CHS0354_025803 [Potamilus streckersoni]|uniref:Methyltransferase-like protein 4 n=1 Tax=Potamilus streckersoni TaxID=2493646 RepID=A0AAE0WAL5_9BIVA|nr:hypothetical protein CHS0354_025803 [Potamilus streckersoni]
MAVIVQCLEGWIIDHLKATEKAYADTVATSVSSFQNYPNRTDSLENSCKYLASSWKTNHTNVKEPFMKRKENNNLSMITAKTGARVCLKNDKCDMCFTKNVQNLVREENGLENRTLDSNGHTVASTQDVTFKMLEHNRESNYCVMRGTNISFRLKKDLFAIESPFFMDSQCHRQAPVMNKTADSQFHRKRKRKRNEALNPGEIAALERHEKIKCKIYQAYQHLLKEAESCSYFGKFQSRGQASSFSISNVIDNNRRARIVAEADGPGSLLATLCAASHVPGDHQICSAKPITQTYGVFESTIINEVQQITSSTGIVMELLGHQFLMPPNSRFLLSDLTYIRRLTSVGKFDLIVMDPPWENKSVKRKKKYNSLTNEDLIHLPIPSLANEGCLVVVWVTNRQMHVKNIRDQLFPAWSVRWMAEWYWLKVTRSGEMVYDFDSSHKKPYETLVLGRCHQNAESLGTTRLTEPDDGKVIISVPCSIHSKKPPLDEVLRQYIPESGRCLELFARNLWPGWTSWGNEVLLHQHTDFYEQYCDKREHGSEQCAT